MKITVFIELFMLNPNPLEFLRYLLPFKSYKWKHLNFFNSAWPQCKAFLAYFPLLHVQNVEEWVLMKINQFCFLHQKAKMHGFAAKLILDISEEYWQCSIPDKWNVGSQTHRPQRVLRGFWVYTQKIFFSGLIMLNFKYTIGIKKIFYYNINVF